MFKYELFFRLIKPLSKVETRRDSSFALYIYYYNNKL